MNDENPKPMRDLTAKEMFLKEKTQEIKDKYKQKLKTVYEDIICLKDRLAAKKQEELKLAEEEKGELTKINNL